MNINRGGRCVVDGAGISATVNFLSLNYGNSAVTPSVCCAADKKKREEGNKIVEQTNKMNNSNYNWHQSEGKKKHLGVKKKKLIKHEIKKFDYVVQTSNLF